MKHLAINSLFSFHPSGFSFSAWRKCWMASGRLADGGEANRVDAIFLSIHDNWKNIEDLIPRSPPAQHEQYWNVLQQPCGATCYCWLRRGPGCGRGWARRITTTQIILTTVNSKHPHTGHTLAHSTGSTQQKHDYFSLHCRMLQLTVYVLCWAAFLTIRICANNNFFVNLSFNNNNNSHPIPLVRPWRKTTTPKQHHHNNNSSAHNILIMQF